LTCEGRNDAELRRQLDAEKMTAQGMVDGCVHYRNLAIRLIEDMSNAQRNVVRRLAFQRDGLRRQLDAEKERVQQRARDLAAVDTRNAQLMQDILRVEGERDEAQATCAAYRRALVTIRNGIFDSDLTEGEQLRDAAAAVNRTLNAKDPGRDLLARLEAAEAIVAKLAKFRFSFDPRDQDNGAYQDAIIRLQQAAKAAKGAKP
jgi:hypothetical protein